MSRHMKKMRFNISAIWDEEAKVFYSESDIDGLHIEAKSIEGFESLMREFASEMVFANHISKQDIESLSLADLIPTIFVVTPDQNCGVAA